MGEDTALGHAVLASFASSVGSMLESISILRIVRSRPSCLSEREFGQLMSKLRVLGPRAPGVAGNAHLDADLRDAHERQGNCAPNLLRQIEDGLLQLIACAGSDKTEVGLLRSVSRWRQFRASLEVRRQPHQTTTRLCHV